jgi:hypothetical protein
LTCVTERLCSISAPTIVGFDGASFWWIGYVGIVPGW